MNNKSVACDVQDSGIIFMTRFTLRGAQVPALHLTTDQYWPGQSLKLPVEHVRTISW